MLKENFPIVTISGSTKFKREFQELAAKLSKSGHIVLTVHVFTRADNLPISKEEIDQYEAMYRQHIDMSSEVFVINKEGYIGESTKKEIAYAQSTGKKVTYLYNEEEYVNE